MFCQQQSGRWSLLVSDQYDVHVQLLGHLYVVVVLMVVYMVVVFMVYMIEHLSMHP